MSGFDHASESDAQRTSAQGFQTIVRLGYVSLATDVSTEMVLGVLPLFIVKDLGGNAAILGIIEGVAEAVNYFFRVIAGFLTDKIGRRKPLVLLGYGFSSIAKPLFALAGSWGHVFAVRVADRAGKGIRTSPRDALISDSAARSESGRAFGLHRSLDQLGAILGPVVAFFAIPIIGVRGVFWLSFLPAAIALAILVFFVRDVQGVTRQRSVFQNAKAVLNTRFILLLAILGMFAAGAYNFSFILLRAGSLGVSEGYIPLVYAFLNVATVLFGLPAGMLADRVGKVPVLGLGYLIFLATSLLAVFLPNGQYTGFLLAFMFGSYLAVTETVQRAIIPDFTDSELKGTAYAIYYTLVGLGSLAANSVFGVLWTGFGPASAFYYSSLVSSIAVGALVAFMMSGTR